MLLAALRHDLKVDVAETSHRGHAVGLARRARSDGLDLVVAVGGDGTVNEVVNGLLDEAAGPRTPDLAIVPGGSTNVLARNLGIPEDPIEATGQLLDAVRSGRRRPLGLGRLDERWFTFCAGVGYDADVIRAVEELRARGRRSTLPLYTRAAVRRFFAQPDRRRGGPLTLERDGADPVPGIALAVVTNCAPWTYLDSRPLNPTPQASFDTGLDLFALTRLPLVGTLRHLAEITLTDRGPRGRDVILLHDQTAFALTSSRPVPVQVDGDYLGERTAMTLRSYPAALHLVG